MVALAAWSSSVKLFVLYDRGRFDQVTSLGLLEEPRNVLCARDVITLSRKTPTQETGARGIRRIPVQSTVDNDVMRHTARMPGGRSYQMFIFPMTEHRKTRLRKKENAACHNIVTGLTWVHGGLLNRYFFLRRLF